MPRLVANSNPLFCEQAGCEHLALHPRTLCRCCIAQRKFNVRLGSCTLARKTIDCFDHVLTCPACPYTKFKKLTRNQARLMIQAGIRCPRCTKMPVQIEELPNRIQLVV